MALARRLVLFWYRAYKQMMTDFNAKTRLFVDMPLVAQQRVTLSDAHRHYLVNVMRLAVGAPLTMFNGHDGEWAGISPKWQETMQCRYCNADKAPNQLY